MISFGWKRKSANPEKTARNCLEEEGEEVPEEVAPKRAKDRVETTIETISRLKEEGIKFAEREEFWKATSRFQDCILFTQTRTM